MQFLLFFHMFDHHQLLESFFVPLIWDSDGWIDLYCYKYNKIHKVLPGLCNTHTSKQPIDGKKSMTKNNKECIKKVLFGTNLKFKLICCQIKVHLALKIQSVLNLLKPENKNK